MYADIVLGKAKNTCLVKKHLVYILLYNYIKNIGYFILVNIFYDRIDSFLAIIEESN